MKVMITLSLIPKIAKIVKKALIHIWLKLLLRARRAQKGLICSEIQMAKILGR